MTKAVGQHVWGRLLWEDEAAQDGSLALLLTNTKPEATSDASLILRFAFVTLGKEVHLFPGFLIDDWGWRGSFPGSVPLGAGKRQSVPQGRNFWL